jgi:hypothetical protein
MLPERPNRRPLLMPGFTGSDHARFGRRVPHWVTSAGLRQIKIELRQYGRVFGAFRCIEDFDADNVALIVVVDDDTLRDFRTVL